MKFKLTIPTSLSEITLHQYQKYSKAIKEEENNVQFHNMKAVEVFCGVRINDVRAIRAKDYEEILKDIANVFQSQTPFENRFELDGQEFGFIPDLDDMTLGEYIDLETYLGDVELWHKAMAVMYRPVTNKRGDKYIIEPYETANNYADMMRYSSLDIFMGSQVFFYNLGKDLVKHTLTSSKATVEMQLLMEALNQNGVGTGVFMHWLEEGFPHLGMSLN